MSNEAMKTLKISAEYINSSGLKESDSFRLEFDGTSNGYIVKADELKFQLLGHFQEDSVFLENESETDENKSYLLNGFDENLKSRKFNDNDEIDLRTFNSFQLMPRTAGGNFSH